MTDITPCLWFDRKGEEAANFMSRCCPIHASTMMDAMMTKIDLPAMKAAVDGVSK
jgi:predicted 3-demethylubiquinone-9 3-methyltransferase (glyoxalase superfamily)